MASLKQMAVLFAGAMFLLCLPIVVNSAPQFIVEGDVYCEVCHINFINRLSEPMAGATVRLECRGDDVKNTTYTLEGVTNDKGHYRLTVEGDHGTEECAVTLIKSGRADCDIIPNEGWAIEPSAKVTITQNSGFHDDVRNANPLGFTKPKADPGCAQLFKELEINPTEEQIN